MAGFPGQGAAVKSRIAAQVLVSVRRMSMGLVIAIATLEPSSAKRSGLWLAAISTPGHGK